MVGNIQNGELKVETDNSETKKNLRQVWVVSTAGKL